MSMDRFWDAFIEPSLEAVRPRTLLTVGEISRAAIPQVDSFCRRTDCRWLRFETKRVCRGTVEENGLSHHFSEADAILIGTGTRGLPVSEQLDALQEQCAEDDRPAPLVILHQPEVDVSSEETVASSALEAISFLSRHPDRYELHLVPGFDDLALLFSGEEHTGDCRETIRQLFHFSRSQRHFLECLEEDRRTLQRDNLHKEERLEDQIERIEGLTEEVFRLRALSTEADRARRTLREEIVTLSQRVRVAERSEVEHSQRIDHHIRKRRSQDREIEKLTAKGQAYKRRHTMIVSSRVYRLSQVLWKAKVFVLPNGTLRAILLDEFLTGLGRVVRRIRERKNHSPSAPKDTPRTTSTPEEEAPSPRFELARRSFTESKAWSPSAMNRYLEQVKRTTGVTVIVPVFNAYEDVKRCILSLLRWTPSEVSILMIDDGSTDPRISDLFDRFERFEGVRTLRNPENLGYVKTVNRGIASSTGDVVLLNSDTMVTPRWIHKLLLAAYSETGVATVTPVSNGAGAFAVPEMGAVNPVPPWLSHPETGRIVGKWSQGLRPKCPTGNGFCLFIKREAIDQVGVFDEERFPRGYGEENDFCVRLLDRGWHHLVEDSCFVYHRRSASFGEEKQKLMEEGRRAVDAAHPQYTQLVRAFVQSKEMAQIGERVKESYELSRSGELTGQPRILYVLHQGSGGTPATTADLFTTIQEDFDGFILTSDSRRIALWASGRRGSSGTPVQEWVLDKPWKIPGFSHPELREIYFNVLTRYQIEIVHIRHLLCHSLDLPEISRALGIPVVLSFHDFYLVCPSVHLIDDRDRYCGGVCTEGKGQCRIPSSWIKGIPVLKKGYLQTWRAEVLSSLENIDAFVTTSKSAHDVIQKAYPALRGKDFRVIEHGRDLETESLSTVPDPQSKVRILIPGNIDFHKGSRFIRSLADHDRRHRKLFEFHFLGTTNRELEGIGIQHGAYGRESFAEKVREIRPSYCGVFSVWPETYCHTLTESWAAGIPTFVSNLGTLKERLERHGGGWQVPIEDVEEAYRIMVSVTEDPSAYREQQSLANLDGIRSVREMARDYTQLYRDLLHRKGGRAIEETGLVEVTEAPPCLPRIAVFVPGDPPKFPGSTHVRILNLIRHPEVKDAFHFEILQPEECATRVTRSRFEAVLVQRTALSPEQAEDLIDRCTMHELPLLYEIDDDLLAAGRMKEHAKQYASQTAVVERLLRFARGVLVSTEELRRRFLPYNDRITVIPNTLCEQVWLPHGLNAVAERTMVRAADDRNGQIKLAYVGSPTHEGDLNLIRRPLQRAHDELKCSVHLIGVQSPLRDASFVERIRIPSEDRHYPRFVPWLLSVASWDIALCPLSPHDLNQSKSYLKYLEYACLGIPGVYTKGMAYDEVVRDGETGLLVENDEDSWFSAIRELSQDSDLRERLARNAAADVLENHLMRDHVGNWLEALRSVLEPRQTSQSV